MNVQDRRGLRRRLVAVAGAQAGYFSAAQALDAGYSYQAQAYHAEHGNWLRVGRALYRLPEWPAGRHEDLVRWTLWSGGRAVVSHESALSVHELGVANPGRTHLTVPPGFRPRAAGVVLHRAALDPADVQAGDGFRVTTPLRSLLDAAAGDLDDDQLAEAVADALGQGVLSAGALRAGAGTRGPRAAARVARTLPGGEG